MKKITFITALVTLGVTFCTADTTTPNMGLTIPTIGTAGWAPKLNSNFNVLDSSAVCKTCNNALVGDNTHAGHETFSSTVTVTGPMTVSTATISSATLTNANIAGGTFAGTASGSVTGSVNNTSVVTSTMVVNSSMTVLGGANLVGNVRISSAVATNFTVTDSTATNLTASSTLIAPGASCRSGLDCVVTSTISFSPTTHGIRGTTTNDSALTGIVGEYKETITISGAPVTLVSGAAKTVASVSLTAGDWDVSGLVGYAIGTTFNYGQQSISLTDNTNGNEQSLTITVFAAGTTPAVAAEIFPTNVVRVSVASTTSVYLVGQSVFGSTCSAYGVIRARRAR